MMKEFGVQFYIECKQFSSCNLSTGEIDKNEKTIQIDFEEEYLDQILGSFQEIKNLKSKIYAALQSEHIFKPSQADIGIERNLHSTETCYFGGKYWAYENEELQIKPNQQRVKIIYRDGKGFFMPEEMK